MDVCNFTTLMLGYAPNLEALNLSLECAKAAGLDPVTYIAPKEMAFASAVMHALAQPEIVGPVLLLLDDYAVIEADHDRLADAAAFVADEISGCVRVYPCPPADDERGYTFSQILPGERYCISLQAAMWDKDALRWLACRNPTWSPWAFEMAGSDEWSEQEPFAIHSVKRAESAISYRNLLRLGCKQDGEWQAAIDGLKQEG